ncbi:DUF305 domain-containing protein [Paractinoplanes globisporus]|uniref:DUF305 domain-containing protein n=1 Tax=Paractinoplanes globisporus TaxID=113565 RepID=A0ABW6WQR7_9ACTN|nr:DUF305 domain-containing protein [Actinoplanes globisporus]
MKRLLLVLLFLPSLAACGSAAPSPAATLSAQDVAEIQAGDKFNDTDVMFLQMLVYHQKQGLEMTATAASRAQSPDLKVLAQAVQATEKDELSMMKSWLTQWKRPVDVDTTKSLHADHGGLPATGPAEIKALKTVSAAAFDTAFLNLFLAHQHNAIEMAHLETTNGANEAVKAYAARVRESRQGEVQQMLRLMNG